MDGTCEVELNFLTETLLTYSDAANVDANFAIPRGPGEEAK
jgi:hypothetical protein